MLGLALRTIAPVILFLSFAFSSSAAAAPPAPIYTWGGFYLGAHAGYGWGEPNSRIDWFDTVFADGPHPPAVPAAYSKGVDGFVGGGQFGWNYQMGSLVAGLEADISFTDINGAISRAGPLDPPFITPYAYEESLKLKWLGTVRGRLGFTPSNNWLLYVTGGLAYGEAQAETNLRFFDILGVQSAQYRGSATETKVGWTIGGGTEMALAGNWSARLEYLYYDLGTLNVSGLRDPAVPALFTVNDHDVNGHIVRVGFSYRLGHGAR